MMYMYIYHLKILL